MSVSITTLLVLGALLLVPLLIVGGGTLIYYFIYQHTINKRLAEGVTNKRKLISPVWMPMILLAAMALLFPPAVILLSILVINGAVASGSEVVVEEENVYFTEVEMEDYENSMYTDTAFYSAAEMQEGFRSVYSMEENPGFTKLATADLGQMQMTCFVSEEPGNMCTPLYLAYTSLPDDIPEDAIVIAEAEILWEGQSLYYYGEDFLAGDLPICLMGAMELDAGGNAYTLLLTCIAVDADGADHTKAYLADGEEIPDEYILAECRQVEFALSGAE